MELNHSNGKQLITLQSNPYIQISYQLGTYIYTYIWQTWDTYHILTHPNWRDL